MFLTELFSGPLAPLFHGYTSLDHAYSALKNNKMLATSTQRFWDNGIRLKDNHPEYNGSYWMKGISTTRDVRYAMKWGMVVFELDQTKIVQKYKMIPFNWGYSIPSGNHHKKEREEFIILKSNKDKYIDSIDNEPKNKKFNWNRFINPEGEMPNLNNYLLGIYMVNDVLKYTSKASEIDFIKNHPKFKGFYDFKTCKFTDEINLEKV